MHSDGVFIQGDWTFLENTDTKKPDFLVAIRMSISGGIDKVVLHV